MIPNEIICGDCLEVMKDWPDNSFDAVVTDIPYGIGFMGKEWDTFKPDFIDNAMANDKRPHTGIASQRRSNTAGAYDLSRNAEYQEWCRLWSAEALRIAKPGAFLLCFGGTRTSHRLTCGLEDAGWLIRDKICWIFGSGFPKSTNISLQFDKVACREQLEKELGRKPTKEEFKKAWKGFRRIVGKKDYTSPDIRGNAYDSLRTKERERLPVNIIAPTTDIAKLWNGYGTALKPAYEDIIVAMKPLDGTFAANAERHGVAGLNIDAGRISLKGEKQPRGSAKRVYKSNQFTNEKIYGDNKVTPPEGRWPANVILDEESAAMLDEQSGERPAGGKVTGKQSSRTGDTGIYGHYEAKENSPFYDSGGASRFFYCAKASRAERNAGLEGITPQQIDPARKPENPGGNNPRNRGARKDTNHHPTVKPLALMEYLCKLLRPPGEHPLLLDPFCGSGTTLIAAYNTGWDWVGIEKEPEYVKIAEKRIHKKTEQYSLIDGS